MLEEIKVKGVDKKVYSDIFDDSGSQYADLVQEGGGVLGIALAGYIFILEKAGIRFFSIAGTSAGAISAMLTASLVPIGEPVSLMMLKILSEKDLSEFADGHPSLNRLIRRYIEGRSFFGFFFLLNFFRIVRTLRRHCGINPGEDFENWFTARLKEAGIVTLSDLNRLRERVPLLYDRSENNRPILRKAGLKIITSDITTKSKVVFPDMASLYWPDPELVNPAVFVRASMSVPFFFYPFVVKNIPGAGEYEDPNLPKEKTKWRKYAGYYGKIPPKVSFVDGGMLSNFPVNAFHLKRGIPKKPTFGVRLSTWRDSYTHIRGAGSMTGAMIGTMKQLHDYDFLLKNPDYNKLICLIEADRDFNWLDFNMSLNSQVKLFTAGAKKAVSFLEGFDWHGYKEIRRKRDLDN